MPRKINLNLAIAIALTVHAIFNLFLLEQRWIFFFVDVALASANLWFAWSQSKHQKSGPFDRH